jgi:Tfp pilus assembly protein PilX
MTRNIPNNANIPTHARTPAPRRRGVAMLMIVIALVVTTVLTTTLVTSRDTMTPMADNAVEATRAKWSAESAANFTTAALSSGVSVDAAPGGTMLSNYSIAGSNATVKLTTLDGQPATAADREVLVTVATTTPRGVTKTSQRVMELTPKATSSDAVDLWHGEFAVLAAESLRLEDGWRVTRWPRSPEQSLGEVRVGTAFESAGDAVVGSGSGGVRFVTDARADTGLAPRLGEGVVALPVKVPTFESEWPLAIGAGGSAWMGPGTLPTGAHDTVEVSGGTLVLEPGDYAVDSMRLTAGASLNVRGDVRLAVEDDLTVEGLSGIYLEDGARLLLYVGGDMVVRQSLIGPFADLKGPLSWDMMSPTRWASPKRIRVLIGDGGGLRLRDGALMLARVNAPEARVHIHDHATLLGNVVGGEFILDRATVAWCPTLDNGSGLTALDGPLYDDEGDPIAGLAAALEAVAGTALGTAEAALKGVIEAAWGGETAGGSSAYGKVNTKTVPLSAKEGEEREDTTNLLRSILGDG